MRKLVLIITLCSIFLANDTISINFKGLDIRDFVKMVAKIKDENILMDSGLNGKVNFISVKPIPKKSLMVLLNHVLETKGYTLVRTHFGYLKVVKIIDAGRSGLPVNSSKDTFQIVTEIIEVENMNVDILVSKLRHLVTKNSKITTSKDTNAIIVTDYPQKIKSIKRIIKLLSNKSQKKIRVIKLKHIKANVIGADITKISKNLFDAKIATNKLEIITNTKTNTITLVGKKSQVEKLTKIINKADSVDDQSSIVMEVIRVNNSDAKDIIKILNKFYAKKGKNILYQPSFTNDTELNAVIVRARQSDVEEVRKIVTKLDVPKPQVYVKAKIIEVSNNKASDVGIKYGLSGGRVTSESLVTMSANLGGSAVAIDTTLLGYIEAPSNVREIFSLGATLSLLETEGAAEVLSEPSLLCLNNKESEIYVGNTQSVVTSSSKANTSTADTTNQYKREDIGLTLKIKPRLSSDNKVTLEIETVIEDVLGTDANGQPITTKRTIKTTAIVKDTELVMLGGLNKVKDTTTISKVPFLGDIPLLGALFTNTTKTKSKASLSIMLIPYIIDENRSMQKLKNELSKMAIAQDKYTAQVIDILKDGKLIKNETLNKDENDSFEDDIEQELDQEVEKEIQRDKAKIEAKKVTKKEISPKQKINKSKYFYVNIGFHKNKKFIKKIKNDKNLNLKISQIISPRGDKFRSIIAGPYDTKAKAQAKLSYIYDNYTEDVYIQQGL
ncbi:MAG: hypothetical protein B1H07_00695 [Campylobacteraceae bacterium 4484_166]|nr:MAG: hypothetical protein B1H07_00695 [Campylobacteraceae bacterium 4484_166]